jgi:hypothetical protein
MKGGGIPLGMPARVLRIARETSEVNARHLPIRRRPAGMAIRGVAG